MNNLTQRPPTENDIRIRQIDETGKTARFAIGSITIYGITKLAAEHKADLALGWKQFKLQVRAAGNTIKEWFAPEEELADMVEYDPR